ncbi:hypothetical protein ACHAWF_016903, partial [Thalassiosira exigua]
MPDRCPEAPPRGRRRSPSTRGGRWRRSTASTSARGCARFPPHRRPRTPRTPLARRSTDCGGC